MSTIVPVSPPSSVPPQLASKNRSTTVLAVAAWVALLYFGRVFFITLVIAAIIALILDPAVTALLRLRFPRAVGSFIVCFIALLILYLTGLGLYTEFAGLADELPTYSARINALVDNMATRVDQMETSTMQLVVPKRFQENGGVQQPVPATGQPRARNKRKTGTPVTPDVLPAPVIPEVRIHAEQTPLISYVYGYIRSFYDVLLMASFVPFLVYFMLSWRDHLRRSFLYLFPVTERHIAGKSWEGVADMARAYVLGNFILGVIMSVLSSSFFFAIGLPYWPLVGPLSGFLTLVPYVGLPLAMAPPILAGLAVFDKPPVYLMIAAVIAFLHLFGMNVLYPKMVGARVHLNPLVVTIALMFWGTLWGGIGLLLAIPITAGIKAVCDTVESLHGYGKLLGD